MTLKELRDDLLRKVWVEYPNTAPDFVFEDVTIAINAALQIMWSGPVDYFRRTKTTFSLTTAEKVCDQNVQEVIGPVIIASTGAEIIRALDQQQFTFAAQRHLGSAAMDSAVPIIYWVDAERQSADDSVKVTMRFSPTPAASTSITMIVATEAPSYSVATVTSANAEVVPIPHKYVESILLPLARNEIAKSHWFWDDKNRAPLKESAGLAMALLSSLDPDAGTRSTSNNKMR
jgi:hypothetical protein